VALPLRAPVFLAVVRFMRCSNCGGTELERAEYKMADGRAPAWQCSSCNTLILDASLARTKEERDSVRLAIAERAAVTIDRVVPETGTEAPQR
jgi:hypothetical protein